MRRSRSVQLTLLASAASVAAAALTACGGAEEATAHCVDRVTERVVPDSLCGPAPVASTVAQGDTAAHRRPGLGMAPFLWYYGGRVIGGAAFGQGGRVSGGSWAPAAGRSYRTPATAARGAPRAPTARGGFGTTGASRGVGG